MKRCHNIIGNDNINKIIQIAYCVLLSKDENPN